MKTRKRWVLSALAAAGALSAATPSWAAAPVLKGWINGQAYTFSYVSGNYNSLVNTLQAQPWWGNPTLATGSQETIRLKLANITTSSAYANAVGSSLVSAARWSDADAAPEIKSISRTNSTITWLTATSIAAPEIDGGKLPLTMMLLGLLYYFGLRRKDRAQA